MGILCAFSTSLPIPILIPGIVTWNKQALVSLCKHEAHFYPAFFIHFFFFLSIIFPSIYHLSIYLSVIFLSFLSLNIKPGSRRSGTLLAPQPITIWISGW